MSYTPQTWLNTAAGGTPLSADRLTHMETGIDNIDDRVAVLEGAGGGGGGPGTLVTGLDLGTGSGTDASGNRTKINNAITSLSGRGLIRLPKGDIRFTGGRITVPDCVGMFGEGGGDQDFAGTQLICVASGDGVTVEGGMGKLSQFKVDGNNVANYPMIVNLGAHRVFELVGVVNALLDSWTINKMQNSIFARCYAKTAARHNIVLDLGCGGLAWYNLENAEPGVSNLKVQQSGASPEVYAEPSHVTFHHSLFEHSVADAPLLDFDKGFNFKFDQCVLQSNRTSSTTAAMVELTTTGPVVWEDGHITAAAGGAWTAFRNTDFSRLVIAGRPIIYNNIATFIDNPSGEVKMLGEPVFFSTTAWVSAGTPSAGDQNVAVEHRHPVMFSKASAGSLIIMGKVVAETGERFRMLADGTMTWGSGSDYSFPLQLGRNSDGTALRINGATKNTTAPSAGGAGALPATPLGYLRVNLDGTNVRIPYYT